MTKFTISYENNGKRGVLWSCGSAVIFFSNYIAEVCVITASVAFRLPINIADVLSLFPRGVILTKEENKSMKLMKQTLMIFAMVVGLSAAAFAQKDDKKPPPKEKPPVVTPQPKNPPPDQNKPKKPNSEFSVIWKQDDRAVA